jgi:hypothetical protein
MQFRILVTDVTRYGTLYCVAGWDLERGSMVRPEPNSANQHDESSRFWNAEVAGPGRALDARNVVTFEAEMPPATFPYPHASEDRIVVKGGTMHPSGAATIGEMRQAVSGGISGSVRAAFDGGLQRWNNGKASVPEGRAEIRAFSRLHPRSCGAREGIRDLWLFGAGERGLWILSLKIPLLSSGR